MAYKLFIDTNVFLDFLMQRGKGWDKAEAIFKLAEQGEIEIFTSASSLLNIMYVMQTYKLDKRGIISAAMTILGYTTLINPDNITFEIALSSPFKDMEDVVQYYTALEIKNCSFFITSNTKHYRSSLPHLPVVTAAEFIDMYAN